MKPVRTREPAASLTGAHPRPSGALAGRLAGGLVGRIILLAIGVLVIVQAVQIMMARSLFQRQAQDLGAQSLGVGEQLWRSQLALQADRPRAAALRLASDAELRQALAADAPGETFDALLAARRRELGADVVALLDGQGLLRAAQAGSRSPALAAALVARVRPMLVQGLAAGVAPAALLADGPLQFAAVPMMASSKPAWAVVAMGLPASLGETFSRQTGLDIALVGDVNGGAPQIVASSLKPAQQAALLRALRSGQRADAPAPGELDLDGAKMSARTLLHEAGDGVLRVVLLKPLAPAADTALALILMLLGGALLGVLGLLLTGKWIGRRLTASLRTLVRESERLARGEYGVPMQDLQRPDELGDLARAFDHMRQSIAANENEIRRLAYTDRLTEIPNRARFRDAVHGAIGLDPQPGQSVAVILLDLDRMKHVNDVLGYASGDRVLKAVAQRLQREAVREGDLVARLGGDEFGILLPHANAAVAQTVAQRIVSALEQPLVLDDQTIDLGAGLGIACWPEHAPDAYALLQRAEVAMYSAKRRHDDTAVIYDDSLDAGSAQSLSLMSELRRALDAAELRLYLQPKVRLADGALVGAEALVRWQHPQRGLVPPMEFIPFAEQTGFVRRLTLWMFEEAARQWATLQRLGPIRLSINLSTRDLMDAKLPSKLKAILARHQAPASGFCLEITESAIMDDPQRALRTLMALSLHDFKLSIDDFGTGYSSLAYLKQLPVNELKIDKSFVMGMAVSPDDQKIVRSTIDLAHNLGLSVVAEGIETAALYSQLAGLACDEGQGYHMAKPLPAAEFAGWARRWAADPAGPARLAAAAAPLGEARRVLQ